SQWVRLSWLFGWGRVDLLHVRGRVRLSRLHEVPSFLEGELGSVVSDYVVELLERRQGFLQQTYLSRVLVDLVLAVCLVSRFARASAVGQGRERVNRADVLEGIGIADLLLAHQADSSQTLVLANLRLQLMSDGEALRRFVASEAG
ncbi:MAG TPA: YkgJ family cysteine cluster protein, partial [Polyangiaceae bacterium]|nr:YkgJ family cysteine cluster protein [Polyangiaceae bacterium]